MYFFPRCWIPYDDEYDQSTTQFTVKSKSSNEWLQNSHCNLVHLSKYFEPFSKIGYQGGQHGHKPFVEEEKEEYKAPLGNEWLQKSHYNLAHLSKYFEPLPKIGHQDQKHKLKLFVAEKEEYKTSVPRQVKKTSVLLKMEIKENLILGVSKKKHTETDLKLPPMNKKCAEESTEKHSEKEKTEGKKNIDRQIKKNLILDEPHLEAHERTSKIADTPPKKK